MNSFNFRTEKSDKEDASKAGGCIFAVVLIFFSVAGAIWAGYAMATVWNWHIAGWNGLPEAGYKMMTAFDLVVGLLLGTRGMKSNYKPETLIKRGTDIILLAIFAPVVALFVGWLLKVI